MKRKIGMAVLLVALLNVSNAKDYTQYYKLCNEALTYKALEKYQEAIETFNKAFALEFPFPDDINELKECYLVIGDKENAYQAARRMILCGYKFVSKIPVCGHPRVNIEYKISLNDALLEQKLESEYPFLREQFLKQVDPEKDKWMEYCRNVESFIAIMRSMDYDGDENVKFEATILTYKTELNLLINLFQSDKKISREETDQWIDFRFVMGIIHASQTMGKPNLSFSDKEKLSLWLSLLKKHVKEGNLHPFQFAHISDMLLDRQEKKTTYATYYYTDFDEKTGTLIKTFSPINDIKNIDSIREEASLPPLWVFCKLKSFDLPKDYKY